MTLAEALRIVMWTLLGLHIGQSVYIITYYQRHYVRLHAKEKGSPHLGLIPLHVMIISTLFLAFAGEAVLTSSYALRHHFNYAYATAIYNVIFLVLANYALWLILSFERRRFSRSSPPKKKVAA